MLKVLNVNTSLDLRRGGGTAERTFQMSRFIGMEQGVQCTVLALDLDVSQSRLQSLLPARAVLLKCIWTRFYIPLFHPLNVRSIVANVDIIHLMGHWSILNAIVYISCRLLNKPYVLCPAGTLPIFGRSRLIKTIYNLLIGNQIVRNAAACIAVTRSELADFKRYGVDPKNVVVIPNGINRQDFPKVDAEIFLSKFSLKNVPFLLFMGRLNLIKGPDILLSAFIQLADNYPDLHLVFAGPDEGMLPSLMDAVKNAGLLNRVHFLGYLAGDEKNAAYRAAKLLVIPSRQEAMSIVAIEAGICGLPVLMTDRCGFGEVREVDARLEVPATREGIVSGLTALLDRSAPLPALAEKWTIFIERNFTWSTIGPKYCELYRTILGRT
jgi:glycosyltransferase involved in cell wall biosynthesis